MTLSHVGPDGGARMVDGGGKAVTRREAVERPEFDYGTTDGYRYFLEMGSLENSRNVVGADVPYWYDLLEHTTYDGRQVKGGAPHAEHLARTTTTTPDGTVSVGAAQVEFFLDPPYLPYGLTAR